MDRIQRGDEGRREQPMTSESTKQKYVERELGMRSWRQLGASPKKLEKHCADHARSRTPLSGSAAQSFNWLHVSFLLSSYGIIDGEVFGQDRDYAELLNNTVISLSQEQLRFVSIFLFVRISPWLSSR